MPFTTEQMREYQRNRAHERLALARERLGGRCYGCGSTEALDFDHTDHTDRTTKIRKISEATNWSLVRFLAEVDKCQLLCRSCHTAKSIANGDLRNVGHGEGVKGKRGCQCPLCSERRRLYARELRRRKRRALLAVPVQVVAEE